MSEHLGGYSPEKRTVTTLDAAGANDRVKEVNEQLTGFQSLAEVPEDQGDNKDNKKIDSEGTTNKDTKAV